MSMKVFDYLLWQKPLAWIRRCAQGKAGTARHPFLTRGQKRWPLHWWPMMASVNHRMYDARIIKPLLRRYRMIISDRYFYDFAASFSYYGYGTPGLIEWYVRSIPRPAHVMVLTLPPEIAFARAQELSLDYFESQCQRYERLAQRYGFRLIDTNRRTEEVRDEIFDCVRA